MGCLCYEGMGKQLQRPMNFWPRRLRSGLMLIALSIAGCAGSDHRSPDAETSWARALGAKVKAGLDAIEDAVPDGPPMSRIVYGSERCMIAPEGGADCKDAARQICKSRGFSSGRAVDTASISSCRPQSFAELHRAEGLYCQTKHQVTASLCW